MSGLAKEQILSGKHDYLLIATASGRKSSLLWVKKFSPATYPLPPSTPGPLGSTLWPQKRGNYCRISPFISAAKLFMVHKEFEPIADIASNISFNLFYFKYLSLFMFWWHILYQRQVNNQLLHCPNRFSWFPV